MINMDFSLSEKYNMLPPGSTVICAVSGGKDSVYLLHSLRLAARERGLSLVCAHFNHRLRGEESERDENFVRELCADWGVEFHSGAGDVATFAAETGMSIEAAARELRYEYLSWLAGGLGAVIATAHTADDNAETILLNLARGAGLKGMCGIPPVRGVIVRPLLETTRGDIEKYLTDNGIPSVEDSTNAGDDYTRNRLRHHVVPVLRDINPKFTENASRTAALLSGDEEYLSSLARDFISKNECGGALPASGLAELPVPVSSRVFRTVAGRGLESRHIDALLALCSGADPSAELSLPGMTARREYEKLVFGAPPAATIPERQVIVDGELAFPEAGLLVKCSVMLVYEEVCKLFNTFYFDYERICGNISVTSRQDGDAFRPYGRNCTKTLKKLFSDANVPSVRRDLIPVFRDDAGIIAVYGFGVDERVYAQPGKQAYKIEIFNI